MKRGRPPEREKLSVMIPVSLKRTLEKRAAQDGRKLSGYMRRLLDQVVKKGIKD